MKNKYYLFVLILLLSFATVFFTACGNPPKENAGKEYLTEIKEWDAKRAERLKAKDGWLNLAGLFWLKEGQNKFGSSKENDIVFPEGKASEFIGTFYLENGKVNVIINDGVEVSVNNSLIKEINAIPDIEENTTVMEHKNLSWFVIVRDEKIGIRLRDYDSELVKTFDGIERFPVDTTWIVRAKYKLFDTPKKVIVPNILGFSTEEEVKGEIVFEKDGSKYKLLPIPSGSRYFLIFADETSGGETYGAGRFLYTEQEDENGSIVIDFNKAYNPPCAFTKYATCPLPPKENHLKLALTAGEKNWGNH